MKLALVGSASTGKTTLVTAINERLGIKAIPEFAREIIAEMGKSSPKDLTPDESYYFENEILRRKIKMERRYEDFIADRSTADNAVYYLKFCSRYFDDKHNAKYVQKAANHLKIYDKIIVLPWNVIPYEEDGFRSDHRYYQYEMHCCLLGFLHDNNVKYEVMKQVKLKDRVDKIMKYYL